MLLVEADDGNWQPQVTMPVSGRASDARRAAPAALPPNPRMAVPGLDAARRLEMAMEGGAMRGMQSARHQGHEMGFRELAQQGLYWALAGQAGHDAEPFARLALGETVRLRLDNRTAFAHGMHLHGMHFREVLPDGGLGPMRDTLLTLPDRPVEIAFVADNPGKWMLHCHMLGHAASGMMTWVDVA